MPPSPSIASAFNHRVTELVHYFLGVALEREMRQRTDRLGSLWVGQHLQQALDADTFPAEQAPLVRQWPKPLKNDGKVIVMVRTVQGLAVPVRLPSDRRQGQRRAGKRDAGVYAGLIL